MTMTMISTTIAERTPWKLSCPQLYRYSRTAKDQRSGALDNRGLLESATQGMVSKGPASQPPASDTGTAGPTGRAVRAR